MPGGIWGCAAAIAACTSWAAASMLRSSVNWIVIWVVPRALVEVIESMPAMVENCFSSGVATAEAMVSGLAPGRLAVTWMVGKSMLGRSLPGGEPARDDDVPPVGCARHHRPRLHGLVRLDHEHVLALLAALHRLGRHQHRADLLGQREGHVDELARPEGVLGVLERG